MAVICRAHSVAYPNDATVQEFAVEPGAVDQVFGNRLAGDLLNVPARLRKPTCFQQRRLAKSGGPTRWFSGNSLATAPPRRAACGVFLLGGFAWLICYPVPKSCSPGHI
jgi:hypothetical protein